VSSDFWNNIQAIIMLDLAAFAGCLAALILTLILISYFLRKWSTQSKKPSVPS
jgi:hypothetical protein